MKKISIVLISCLIICIFINVFLYKSSSNINKSIVYIESFNDEYINKGMGFVYKINNKKTYILTNYHVVEQSNEIYIYNLKKERIKANLYSYDIYSDIAILKLDADFNLKTLNINKDKSNNSDKVYYFNIKNNKLEEGKILSQNNQIYINNSYGLSVYTATAITGDIEPGNSGGPILNKNNEVIGILCLKDKNDDIGYYISMDSIKKTIKQLEKKELERPNLGAVFVDSFNTELLNKYGYTNYDRKGIVVVDIKEKGSLYNSGINKGDLIVSVNDISVSNTIELQKEIYKYNIGDVIKLSYYSDKIYKTISIALKK